MLLCENIHKLFFLFYELFQRFPSHSLLHTTTVWFVSSQWWYCMRKVKLMLFLHFYLRFVFVKIEVICEGYIEDKVINCIIKYFDKLESGTWRRVWEWTKENALALIIFIFKIHLWLLCICNSCRLNKLNVQVWNLFTYRDMFTFWINQF